MFCALLSVSKCILFRQLAAHLQPFHTEAARSHGPRADSRGRASEGVGQAERPVMMSFLFPAMPRGEQQLRYLQGDVGEMEATPGLQGQSALSSDWKR